VSGEIRAARTHGRDLELDCDVVVVGSGAGGAVTACVLAEAGQDVVVLEEGAHVRPDEYAHLRPSESLRHVWREAGMTMAVGVGASPMINVMMGRCVGGSSVLTGGVCFRVPEAVLTEWSRDLGLSALTAEALEPCYAEVERTVAVAPVPPEARSRSTALFAEGAARLGYAVHPMRRNTRGCRGWATCNFGCPEGAKQSVDVSYLPRAVAAGARIWADCRVDRVRVDGARARGVEGRLLDGPGGGPGRRLSVRARRVVLSAGSVHTPLILMRSGIGRRSRQVGRNLTLHPAFRVMARFDERVDGWHGALQSAFSSDFEPEGVQLNSIFVPAGVLAATQPGVGSSFLRRARNAGHLAIFGANLHDLGGGSIHRLPFAREPLIRYRMAPKDRAAIPRALRIAGDTFLAAGAREIFLPILGMDGMDADQFRAADLESISPRRLECTSQHPLGTCRMGRAPEHSVVDPDHQTWDVAELFLVDGSVVPTSLGVNPQLTIMTLATRAAWGLRERPLQG
jgi:choline dehydrogenase-like flavoprotein